MSLKVLNNKDSCQVPVINLSSQVLDAKPLKYGLHQSFTDKSKFVKRNVVVEFEALAASLDHSVKQSDKKAFGEYLGSCTNIITKNIYKDKYDTFTSLQKFRKNKDMVILLAVKESCIVILTKNNYVCKIDQMIEDSITEDKYIKTSDNILCDLKQSQVFLYRPFYKHKDYEAMHPRSNQPGRFFATSKTHKFKSIEVSFKKSQVTSYN